MNTTVELIDNKIVFSAELPEDVTGKDVKNFAEEVIAPLVQQINIKTKKMRELERELAREEKRRAREKASAEKAAKREGEKKVRAEERAARKEARDAKRKERREYRELKRASRNVKIEVVGS